MESLIIEKAVIVSFSVMAIWCCMLETMIFGRIRNLNIPEWMEEPLYGCVVCMTPYYGSAIYWIFLGDGMIEWILVILVSMGIATFFVKIKKD